MLLGIFSDVHDHLENLKKALSAFRKEDIHELIFCGDFCSPIPVKEMGRYEGTIHCVFGNGDGDRFAISNLAHHEYKNLKLYGEYAELEFDGKKIAVTHYPFYGEAIASTGKYAAVFAGHYHEAEQKTFGQCLYANPGEVLGAFSNPTVGIYDTNKNEIRIIQIG